MTLTRAVQCDLTWTEDRAPVRTDPSAAPRAETEGRAVARHGAALPSLRDRHQCDKPLRQDAATALGTMPRLCPLRQAHLIPVHGEPRQLRRAMALRPNLLIMGISVAAIGYGLIHDLDKPTYLAVMVFWCLWTIVALSRYTFVALSSGWQVPQPPVPRPPQGLLKA